MRNDRNKPGGPRNFIWIAAAVLIVAAVLVALQGVVRGGGEAIGIDEAAPGATANKPAGKT